MLRDAAFVDFLYGVPGAIPYKHPREDSPESTLADKSIEDEGMFTNDRSVFLIGVCHRTTGVPDYMVEIFLSF